MPAAPDAGARGLAEDRPEQQRTEGGLIPGPTSSTNERTNPRNPASKQAAAAQRRSTKEDRPMKDWPAPDALAPSAELPMNTNKDPSTPAQLLSYYEAIEQASTDMLS